MCNTYLRRTTDRAIDFLIGRKHSRKDRQVKVSFRELKAQIYWPTTDQKVWGSNPYGRTILLSERKLLASFSDRQSHSGNLENLA